MCFLLKKIFYPKAFLLINFFRGYLNQNSTSTLSLLRLSLSRLFAAGRRWLQTFSFNLKRWPSSHQNPPPPPPLLTAAEYYPSPSSRSLSSRVSPRARGLILRLWLRLRLRLPFLSPHRPGSLCRLARSLPS